MKTTVNCHTCKYSDWGYKYLPAEINPCDKCIGYHKWAKRRKDNPNVPKPKTNKG